MSACTILLHYYYIYFCLLSIFLPVVANKLVRKRFRVKFLDKRNVGIVRYLQLSLY